MGSLLDLLQVPLYRLTEISIYIIEWDSEQVKVITCLNKSMNQLKLFMITVPVHSGKLVKIIVASEASHMPMYRLKAVYV